MNREAETVENVNSDDEHPAYTAQQVEVTDKLTRAKLSQKIKDAVAAGHSPDLHSYFNFMLVNEYTPEQIVQEIDYTHAQNSSMLKPLTEWSENSKEHKKLKVAGKAAFIAVTIYFNNHKYAATIKAIELFRNCKDAPHEFSEAVDLLEINAWLGLLQQEVEGGVPITTIMKQLEALRLKHIWSKELALFAIPVTTAYFREIATEKMDTGDFKGAYRDLEQALLLPEEDRHATFYGYADCITRQINDPRFRLRASLKDLDKLAAKIDYLKSASFWVSELELTEMILKELIQSRKK